jgi:hypothetical protein
LVAAALVEFLVGPVEHHAKKRALMGVGRCGIPGGVGAFGDDEIAERSRFDGASE